MYFSDETKKFAEGRETSEEICQVIMDMAENLTFVPRTAEQIWQDPQGSEDDILAAAWVLTDDDTEELFWGGETFTRPVKTEMTDELRAKLDDEENCF